MKKIKISVFIFFIILLSVISIDGIGYAVAQEKIDAQALVRQVETQYQGKTSHSIMNMKVVTDSYSREMKMEGWSEGRDKFLAKIISPKKDAGTATLKIGNDIWNYIPKIDRMMKIPSGLMGDSWMGSHLTNDDLVKENKIDELYTFTTEKTEGDTVTILCKPKSEAAVVWDKVIYRIEMKKKTPVDIDYFDESGKLVRIMKFEEVKLISGKWIPLKMTILPKDKPGEFTEIDYTEIEFGVKLTSGFFSIGSLRSIQ
jgi:hypothetical protein